MATSEIQNLIQSQAQSDFLDNNYQTSDHKILLDVKPEIDDIYTKSFISAKEQTSLVSLQTKQKLVENLIKQKEKKNSKRRKSKTIVNYESLPTIDFFTHKYMTTKLSVDGKARNDYVNVNSFNINNGKKKFGKKRNFETIT